MRLINAKQFFNPIPFLAAGLLYLSIGVSSAEWIQAKVPNSKNDIWINTETNALYVGNNCTPLMKLRHLSGTKPRSLQQRQQAYLNQPINNSDAGKKGQNTLITSPSNKVNKQKVGIQLDPLNLNYQTQPGFDPLNRNDFNISIDNNNIVLSSQHSLIKAKVRGRYDRRTDCGL